MGFEPTIDEYLLRRQSAFDPAIQTRNASRSGARRHPGLGHRPGNEGQDAGTS